MNGPGQPGPAEPGQPGQAAQPGRPGRLERGYQRLLALYPAVHRQAHQEEMLDVLMAGAPDGQRLPGFADSVDLAWGALVIWLRPGRRARAAWSDALAVVSVVLPLFYLVYFAAGAAFVFRAVPVSAATITAMLESSAELFCAWAILTALVLLRLRRTATLATVALLAWYAVIEIPGQPNWGYLDPNTVFVFAILGLEIVALIASPGRRRGMRMLAWRHYAAAIGSAAVAGLAVGLLPASEMTVSAMIAIAAVAVPLAGMVLASPLSRRVVVLLAIPCYYFVIRLVVPPSSVAGDGVWASGWTGPLRFALTFLPLVLVGWLAVTALRRLTPIPGGAGGGSSRPR